MKLAGMALLFLAAAAPLPAQSPKAFFDDFAYASNWITLVTIPPSPTPAYSWTSPNGLWRKTLWEWDYCRLLPDAVAVDQGVCLLLVPGKSGTPTQKGIGGEIVSALPVYFGLYEARLQVSGLTANMNDGVANTFAYRCDGHGEIAFEFQSRVQERIGAGKGALDIYVRRLSASNQELGVVRRSVALDFNPNWAFHNYAFEWKPDLLRVLVDGREVWRATGKEAWLPSLPGVLRFRNWTGHRWRSGWPPVDAHALLIDWVRYTPGSTT